MGELLLNEKMQKHIVINSYAAYAGFSYLYFISWNVFCSSVMFFYSSFHRFE